MKKKKKLTGQQIKFMINMVSLAIFAFSYLYIYTNYVNKKDSTYQEISNTEIEITSIKDKAAKQDSVLQETEKVNAQIQEILDSYPVDIKKVDNYLFVEQMEKALGITFTDVNPSDSSFFIDTVVPMRNADGTEVAQPAASSSDGGKTATVDTNASQTDDNIKGSKSQSDALNEVESEVGGDTSAPSAASAQKDAKPAATTMTGLQSKITLSFQTTEKGFLELVEYINNYPSRSVIESVSVSVDNTTNQLTGSLVINRYALAGTGKEYEIPQNDGISIGTDDIFGINPGAEEPTPTVGSDETQQETP